jgi:hypothetical protein
MVDFGLPLDASLGGGVSHAESAHYRLSFSELASLPARRTDHDGEKLALRAS